MNVVSVYADMGAGKPHSPASGGGSGYWDISKDTNFTTFVYNNKTATSTSSGDLTLVAGGDKDKYTADEANNDGYMVAVSASVYKLANCKKNDKILIYYYSSKGDGKRSLTIKEDDTAVENGTKSLNNTSDVNTAKYVEHTVAKDNCTVSFNFSGDGVGVYAIDRISTDEPEKATISGKVTLSDKYEYIPHTGVTDDNKASGEPYPYNNNITFDGGSENDKTKTVEHDAQELSITVKGPDGDVTDVKTSGSTYTIGGTDGLTAGQYTITVTADGQKTVETVNMPETPAPQIKDIDIETPSYTVKFVTNIKNFEDNVSSSEKPLLKVKNSEGDLFALNDVTYYNTSDMSVNNGASTTHTIKMPAGNYEYVYKGTDYKLSLSSTDEVGGDSLNFKVSGNSTKNIYFIPLYDEAGAKTEVDTHKDEIIGSVTRGTYTFKTDIIPSNENTPTLVGIDYNSTAYPGESDGTQHGMVAYFVKGLQNNKDDIADNQYLGLSKAHGAIIFKVDTPILAKIETGYKACVLYEIDSTANAINGSHSAIPIDSSFGKRTVSLAPGTYAVISLADPDKHTEAQVKSIEFLVDSPFKVLTENLKDAGDYTIDGADNAKIIIGSYNASEDNLIGTTSAESYEKFAILIAGTQAALDVDAIDGIKEWEETENGYNAGTKNNSVSVTDDSGDYTTDNASVFTMTVFDSSTNKAATVIRDDTNYVFGSIKDDDGKDIITDTSGNTKYYVTIVKGLSAGTYYAAGAAKVKGSTDDGKWLVQGDNIATFEIPE